MKLLYPQTWSMESITPQWKGAFKHDLVKVFKKIYDNIKDLADPIGEKDKVEISVGLKEAFRKQKDLDALLKPLGDVIAKHTNIELERYIFNVTNSLNAFAGPCTVFTVFNSSPQDAKMIQEAVITKQNFKDFVNVYKIANSLDRKTGKLRERLRIGGILGINSKFFDMVYSGDIGHEQLASVILHEVGHVIDSLDLALRMTCVSDLAEDIIQYKDELLDLRTAEHLLDVCESMLKQSSKYFSREFKSVATNALSKLRATPEEERTDDWVSTVGATYTLIVREMESLIGKTTSESKNLISDSVISDDLYRGAERRANKFAVYQRDDEELVKFCEVFVYRVKLMNTFGYSREEADEKIRGDWETLVVNTANYDTKANEADEVLRNIYVRLSLLEKDYSSKELREELKIIEQIRTAVAGMKHHESRFEESYKFLKTVGKYSGRAFGIFFSRNRLNQNSVLFKAIRHTARSSIHADAAKLKALGMEAFGVSNEFFGWGKPKEPLSKEHQLIDDLKDTMLECERSVEELTVTCRDGWNFYGDNEVPGTVSPINSSTHIYIRNLFRDIAKSSEGLINISKVHSFKRKLNKFHTATCGTGRWYDDSPMWQEVRRDEEYVSKEEFEHTVMYVLNDVAQSRATVVSNLNQALKLITPIH